MINHAQRHFNCTLSLRDFFTQATLQALASLIEEAIEPHSKKIVGWESIPQADPSLPIPLSFTQQRVWFLQKLLMQEALYHIPFSIELRGYVCVDSLSYALREVINRHSILRTNIVEQQGQAFQVIKAPLSSFKLERVDLTSLKVEAQAEQLEELLRLNAQKPFNLASDSLLRVLLVALSEERHVLAVTFHHLIADGWSLAIFCRELSAFYNHAVAGDAVNLTPLAIQFSDFAHWQRQSPVSHLEYWLKHLENPPALSTFPTNYRRPAELSYRGRTLSFTLPDDLLQQLKAFSEAQEVTLFMTLLSAFMVLLQRYSQQEDLIIGLPVANRSHPDVEPLIGFFTNTLAFRLQGLESNLRFLEVLQLTKATVLESFEHQEAPFEQVVDHLQVPRMLNANPLFQVMFSYQSMTASPITLTRLETHPWHSSHTTAKFDINFFVQEQADHIAMLIEYATDLYEEETVERLGAHYQQLLTEIMAAPQGAIGAFELLTSSERQKILYDWNNTSAPYPSDVCLHELFEAQVERTPDAIAVRFEDESLSYRELNERSNRLAHALRAEGVGPEVLVAIALDRSFEMIISVLGILKAGGAYVPLDPSFPEERLKFMVEDTQAPIVLSFESSLLGSAYKGKIIDPREIIAQESLSSSNLRSDVKPHHLAYVIYTSGSTGKPKGVMIEHHSAANTILDINCRYSVTIHDNILALSSLTFDLSVYDIFGALAAGAAIVLLEGQNAKDPSYWYECLSKYNVTIWNSVPTSIGLLAQTVESLREVHNLTLRLVLLSGDWIPVELPNRIWNKLGESIKVISLGGATEGSIWSIEYPIDSVSSEWKSIPYGKALTNQAIYIFNSCGKICPFLGVGEIVIGGEGVARGYLNRPELNKEKFQIASLFISSQSASTYSNNLYYTGDLGRCLPDGTIEFLGRKDNQVKIRGFRVEIDEIKITLQELPEVKEALVLPVQREDKAQFISSYILLKSSIDDSQKTSKSQEILSLLKYKLPEYMIPSTLIILDAFPLSANGKIDFNALASAGIRSEEVTSAQPAFKNEIEITLANLFKRILKLESIGLKDNFFQMGGDSLLAIQFVSLAREEGLLLKLKDVFIYPTIEDLSKCITVLEKPVQSKKKEKKSYKEPFTLSPIQQWLIREFSSTIDSITQHLCLELEEHTDLEILQRALETTLSQQEAFYLVFMQKEQKWLQAKNDKEQWVIAHLDLSQYANEDSENLFIEKIKALKKKISIKGPLAGFLLTKHRENKTSLTLIIHHLIIDGISWQILLEELAYYYNQYKKNSGLVEYRERSDTLVDYSNFLETYSKNVSNNSSVISVPQQKFLAPREKEIPARVGSMSLSLDSLTTKLLRDQAYSIGTTIANVIIAALVYSLKKLAVNDSVTLTLEGQTRDLSSEYDFSRTFGWFTTLYPVAFDVPQELNLQEFIGFITRHIHAIPNEGLDYGIMNYYKTVVPSSTLPSILFNYAGNWGNSHNLFKNSLPIEAFDEEYIPLFPLEVNSLIQDDQLKIKFIFDERVFPKRIIEELSQTLRETIREISLLAYGSLAIFQKYSSKIDCLIPLSPTQEGILFHALAYPDHEAYTVQTLIEINGDLDIEALERACNKTIAAYDILRTGFIWDTSDKPIQFILKSLCISLNQMTLQDYENHIQALEAILAAERKQLPSLDTPPLMRFTIVKSFDNKYYFIWTCHHLLLDGQSLAIILESIFSYYQNANQRVISQNTPPAYRDYILWLKKKDDSEDKSFWQNYLTDFDNNYPRIRLDFRTTYQYKTHVFTLSAKDRTRLVALGSQYGLTLSTLLLSIWSLVLSIYWRRKDFLIGLTVSSRNADIPNMDKMAGPLIDTLPFRVRCLSDINFWEFAAQIQKEIALLQQYSHVSPLDIQSWNNMDKATPLFDSIFTYQNFGKPEKIVQELTDIKAQLISSIDYNEYPLTLMIIPEDKISIHVTYLSQFYTQKQAEAFEKVFCDMINNILSVAKSGDDR
ncbi:hypothetical protein IM40_02420 [Candidatus Paracaedimonas acanthamoebae]|nr:hypothetical protein IM40_02420 [Candidatus Paracaedimonas acanthamoebae]